MALLDSDTLAALNQLLEDERAAVTIAATLSNGATEPSRSSCRRRSVPTPRRMRRSRCRLAGRTLIDTSGRPRRLGSLAGRQGTVIVFTGIDCPIGNLYMPRLSELAARYKSPGGSPRRSGRITHASMVAAGVMAYRTAARRSSLRRAPALRPPADRRRHRWRRRASGGSSRPVPAAAACLRRPRPCGRRSPGTPPRSGCRRSGRRAGRGGRAPARAWHAASASLSFTPSSSRYSMKTLSAGGGPGSRGRLCMSRGEPEAPA